MAQFGSSTAYGPSHRKSPVLAPLTAQIFSISEQKSTNAATPCLYLIQYRQHWARSIILYTLNEKNKKKYMRAPAFITHWFSFSLLSTQISWKKTGMSTVLGHDHDGSREHALMVPNTLVTSLNSWVGMSLLAIENIENY